MFTKVQRWGNSLGVRIPKPIAEKAHLGPGSEVQVTTERGRLVIAPVKRPIYSLARLLSKITAKNLHGEVSTGEPIGREQL